jgi:hypothetical protein
MNFLTTMQTYFRGERIEAAGFILPIGLGGIILGAALLRSERTPFETAFAIPSILCGLALAVTGAVVAFRTESQLSSLTALWQADTARFAAEETARMAKVNAAWPVYLKMWIAFVIGGGLLRFALKAEWAHGVGIALLFYGAAGLVIDGFAERRAKPYTQAITALGSENSKS